MKQIDNSKQIKYNTNTNDNNNNSNNKLYDLWFVTNNVQDIQGF